MDLTVSRDAIVDSKKAADENGRARPRHGAGEDLPRVQIRIAGAGITIPCDAAAVENRRTPDVGGRRRAGHCGADAARVEAGCCKAFAECHVGDSLVDF